MNKNEIASMHNIIETISRGMYSDLSLLSKVRCSKVGPANISKRQIPICFKPLVKMSLLVLLFSSMRNTFSYAFMFA